MHSPVLKPEHRAGVERLGGFPGLCIRGREAGDVGRRVSALRARSAEVDVADRERREEEKSRQEPGLAVLRHFGCPTEGEGFTPTLPVSGY